MSDKILYYYDEEANPEGGFYGGVPLADLTEEQFKALPPYLQKSVEANKMYRKTKPQGRKAEKPVEEEAPKEEEPTKNEDVPE